MVIYVKDDHDNVAHRVGWSDLRQQRQLGLQVQITKDNL